MSKKTRKKSSKASPKKAVRAGAKKIAKNSARTAVRTKATAKAPAKPSSKTPPPKKLSKKLSEKPSTTTLNKSAPVAAKKRAANIPVESASVAAVGAPAPNFDLPRDGGEQISLADYAGRKLVIFFYPRADTPGCTREAIDFTRLKADFDANATAVVGVSGDSVKAQESFRDKHGLSVPLMSDEAHQTLLAFGAWGEKSMYGRTFQGVLRTTVLIDSHGRIARIWRGVKVDGHADEVLAAARAL
jgi:peroxiredoxin Q/BCP